ncbi:MAG: hypothetical protein KGI78_00300 [Patescibacteria group bacterium]|nr:hypothetical protein [Patescibacteria group bacterium]MDE1944074.1 hypothetical protein [Patescibacteria group bacterium]MDE1944735.1 hypothetical protein [Patescibacteria group bacterium]MDE2057279.1 hypothetical protein [Patescibacteria group bacterium]
MTTRVLLIAFVILVGVLAYLGSAFVRAPLGVEALAAGQGSASLVRLPNGRVVLVGAGKDASIARALGEALPFWGRHIDALVLPDESAAVAGGAPFVLARYRVGALLVRSGSATPAREAALTAAARAAGVAIQEVPPGAGLLLTYAGRTFDLGSTTIR